jgi:hypothetical protein
MSSTPKTTIDPNTLALHETAQVATHYGHTLWTTKVNGGNLSQWDNGPPAFVPRSMEFKFAQFIAICSSAKTCEIGENLHCVSDPLCVLPVSTRDI